MAEGNAKQVRDLLNEHAANIVSEVYGDLNQEYYFNTNQGRSWAFTAVGISRRGKNDPGFQRVLMNNGASKVMDIENYSMKGKSCEFTFSSSYKQRYAPYFDHGITAKAVKASIDDDRLDAARTDNISPVAVRALTPKQSDQPSWMNQVRMGSTAGCM